MKTATHSIWLKSFPIFCVILCPYLFIETIYLSIYLVTRLIHPSVGFQANASFIIYYSVCVLLSFVAITYGIALSILTGIAVKQYWFFLFQYSYNKRKLVAYDPVFKREHSIQFDEVSIVASFRCPGIYRGSRGWKGHSLISKSGDRIKMTEALLDWPEIFRLCSHAPFEDAKPTWWVPHP